MRALLVSPAVLFAACSVAPGPPRASAQAPVAAVAATSTPPPQAPSSPPPSDEGAPPAPPMALGWTFRLPSFAGRPATTQRLALAQSGDATWESARAGGDGEVDEELTPTAPKPPEVERCHGHVGPAQHKKLVLAARQAMASGCKKVLAADRLGRPVDDGAATLSVTWEGATTSCDVGRSGGTYAAFERARAEVVTAICSAR